MVEVKRVASLTLRGPTLDAMVRDGLPGLRAGWRSVVMEALAGEVAGRLGPEWCHEIFRGDGESGIRML